MTDRRDALDPEPPVLFLDPAPRATAKPPPARIARRDAKRGARLREANRGQIGWGRIDLDAQVPDDDPVRSIWAVVERLELSALYAPIEARDEVAGAPAIDPKILLALWIYATSDGEGSAREIWRLTELHAAQGSRVNKSIVLATDPSRLAALPIPVLGSHPSRMLASGPHRRLAIRASRSRSSTDLFTRDPLSLVVRRRHRA